jgi:adenylate cyclase
MGIEIERKFMVIGDAWRAKGHAVRIVQGYLSRVKERVVRVRTADLAGFLTIKGISCGRARTEFEYPIPLDDARQMLHELCVQPLIDKTRHFVPHKDLVWHVDEFHSPQRGLIIAEIEIPTVDCAFERPDWTGDEVTGDERYYNQNMT